MFIQKTSIFYMVFVQTTLFDLLLVRHMFLKIYSKFFFSATIRRMNLKLGILANDNMNFYKIYFQCPIAFVAMAT